MKKGSEVDIYWNFQNHIEKQQLAFSETESVTRLTKPFWKQYFLKKSMNECWQKFPKQWLPNAGLENVFIQRACTDNGERQEVPEAKLVNKTENVPLSPLTI